MLGSPTMTDLIPAGRMIVHKACIVSTTNFLKSIGEDNEIVGLMLLELQMAAYMAETFNDTWSSIIWIKARKRTRERVTQSLKRLAANVINHIEETIRLFDDLCDAQEVNPTIELTPQWINFKAQLAGIKRDLEDHRKFVERNSIESLPLLKIIEQIKNSS